MLKLNFNRFLIRTYLSDAAIECELNEIESKLLTAVVYSHRHFWKSIEKIGYWYIKIEDLACMLECDEDTLYEACSVLDDLGFIRVEQHGLYLWFYMPNKKAMSDKVKKDLENARESETKNL